MTYTETTPIIRSTKNPIHIIQRDFTKKSWLNLGLWLDFESGSKDPLTPLTKALRFNIVRYDEKGKRIPIFSFKIVSIDELIEFRNAIDAFIKRWMAVLK